MFDQEDMDELQIKAVRKWNSRLMQNLDLYLAGDPRGLNWYPRQDEKG